MNRHVLFAAMLASAAVVPIRGEPPAALAPTSPYSLPVLAQRIAAARNMTAPPVLGKPMSLTPAAPVVPGLAGWELIDVLRYSPLSTQIPGAAGKTETNPGYVDFHASVMARMLLVFYVEPGKRYATDCRTDAAQLYYLPDAASYGQSRVATNTENHNLFVATPVAGSGWVNLTVMLSDGKTLPQGHRLWGCEIVSF